MEYRDYYKILGVAKNADEKEIKRAYRRLARQHHPDLNPGNKAAEERFKEVSEAYEVLGNPKNRVRYDRLGSNYHRFRQMGGNAADFDFSQWFGGGNSGGFNQGGNIDLGDLFGSSGSGFSDFFNTVFGRRRGQTMNQQDVFGRQGQTANRDVEQRVEITLEEAYHGAERVLSQNGDRFTAKIPPGADTGTKIRLQGKGAPGPNGASDLFLVVQLKPHPTFARDGADLQASLAVDVLTAVLGGKVTVPTLTGPVTLTIPVGTQGGQTFRLKGKGLPHLRHKHQFGDLLATVNIRVPTELSPEERKLYEQLAELAQLRSS